jgi:hypothetical protein
MVTKRNALKLVSVAVLAIALAACSRQQSDWQKTRETNTADGYEQFLKKYPSGNIPKASGLKRPGFASRTSPWPRHLGPVRRRLWLVRIRAR